MISGIKKFIISLVSTIIFYALIYFGITLYDQTGETLLWLSQNLYYLIFLFVSIVGGLTLYGREDNKSKLILSIIFFINFIYLIFLFGLSNMGLNNIQGILLIGFLLIGLISIYVQNRVGNIIIILSTMGIFITMFSVLIPIYEKGPDITGFENNFNTQFIVYSKASLNKEMAILSVDKKEYGISNGILNYDFKINKAGSQVIFKSDKQYQNSFGYILFKNKEIIQIYPQSAISIDKNREIEILTGMIKYYPQNSKNFQFTGNIVPSLIVNQENIDVILDRHNSKIKEYVLEQLGGKQYQNKTLLLISQKTLKVLHFLFPKQFENNIKNFELFDEYLGFNLETENYKSTFDNKKVQQGIIKDIKDSLKSTEIIK